MRLLILLGVVGALAAYECPSPTARRVGMHASHPSHANAHAHANAHDIVCVLPTLLASTLDVKNKDKMGWPVPRAPP